MRCAVILLTLKFQIFIFKIIGVLHLNKFPGALCFLLSTNRMIFLILKIKNSCLHYVACFGVLCLGVF